MSATAAGVPASVAALRLLRALTGLGALGFILAPGTPLRAAGDAPLTLETKIPLGEIVGRIDHLAFDPTRQHLYVAELGNNSVGILDLKSGRVVRTVTGFEEPQGIAFEPSTDTVYVANAGDGSVRLFRGEDFAPLTRIALGEDADNVRVDRNARRVYVGYGHGALAVIDPVARKKIADIPLKAHPESFQLDPNGPNIFVNVPDAGQIAVVDRNARKQTASWSTGNLRANFPLAVDAAAGRVVAVFRHPARLAAFDRQLGSRLAETNVCADADDVFVDALRHRVHVICGEGFIDTFALSEGSYVKAGHTPTVAGARTGLYVPEIDRLFVAIRARGPQAAAVWSFRAPKVP